jgi:hypothetical protein
VVAIPAGRALTCGVASLLLVVPLGGQQAPRRVRIPTPRAVLGFEPGDDRKLADWATLVRYYRQLAAASDRVEFRELGQTTLGAPFVALAISSPRNLRDLARYRSVNAALADPRRFRSTTEASRRCVTAARSC